MIDTNTTISWRESSQPLLPQQTDASVIKNESYNHTPFHALGSGKISSGYGTLAEWIIETGTVLIDGYGGIFYDDVYQQIQQELSDLGVIANWYFTADYLKAEDEIDHLVKPFLNQKEDVWGKKTSLNLQQLFNDDYNLLLPDLTYEINIVLGVGSGLLNWDCPIIYLDIPKNEIQYRMRAGTAFNLGKSASEGNAAMYKRFYFVDWVLLDKHRNSLLQRITILVDAQQFGSVNWMFKAHLMDGLKSMAHTLFRVRPWFEKGSWGGQWMKEHIKGLNNDEVNYAWSFELITPENGIVFESDRHLLELSFDFLMLYQYEAVIGKHAAMFGPYFPIRFDFLDTFDGGNLSIQCHPAKDYITEQFGESITQDETYYILDCKPGAKVYLGFQEDIDPIKFKDVLQESQRENKPIEVERFVQSFPSHKHDLFLIPNGTVHSSGVNNMVLEISATPYIFTFKMYDWLSLDLNGNPRPINIEHAFKNLRFERKGAVVEREHISHPEVIAGGEDWELIHLPTHRDHFYDVHRIEFDSELEVQTNESCHVLMLVEGTQIEVVTGETQTAFAYAETFIVPAAANNYKLINKGAGRAKVIKAFIKDETKL
ncbi:MAG: class I mannose-6-phosphate isomerase [Bacteroidota bacterium]